MFLAKSLPWRDQRAEMGAPVELNPCLETSPGLRGHYSQSTSHQLHAANCTLGPQLLAGVSPSTSAARTWSIVVNYGPGFTVHLKKREKCIFSLFFQKRHETPCIFRGSHDLSLFMKAFILSEHKVEPQNRTFKFSSAFSALRDKQIKQRGLILNVLHEQRFENKNM